MCGVDGQLSTLVHRLSRRAHQSEPFIVIRWYVNNRDYNRNGRLRSWNLRVLICKQLHVLTYVGYICANPTANVGAEWLAPTQYYSISVLHHYSITLLQYCACLLRKKKSRMKKNADARCRRLPERSLTTPTVTQLRLLCHYLHIYCHIHMYMRPISATARLDRGGRAAHRAAIVGGRSAGPN